MMVVGLEPTRPEETCFTDRRASQLLNTTLAPQLGIEPRTLRLTDGCSNRLSY